MRTALVRVSVAVALLAMGSGLATAAPPTFQTPEAALEALKSALLADDSAAVWALFGPEYQDELIGADPAAARQAIDAAADAAQQGISLAPGDDDNSRLIVMGARDWPMPIPLVRTDEGWQFDTKEGLEEIIDRRIGENELTAIENARAFVDAQVDYAGEDRDADEVLEYAQKLLSTPGQKDGLYWQDTDGVDPSPLGPLAASEADYTQYMEAGDSFHGYSYKVLADQGANPPGGAYGYVINGNMIAGFGLVAWPADYGSSGIMTFVINQQGKLLQKDLGENTAEIAAAMTAYDPDSTWTEVSD